MLVSFAVSNFRSFAGRQVFSLFASKRLGSAHESHTVPIPDSDQSVLRAGVIYGANGAGKSNLFAALQYMRRVALGQREESRATPRVDFQLADLRDQPTTFDLQFIAAGKLYRFGLFLDEERIINERLAHVVEGKEKLIYVRHIGSAGNVAVDAPGLRNESESLQALVKVRCRDDQSFLARARAMLVREDVGRTLTEVIEWLDGGLALIGPQSTLDLSVKRLAKDGEFRQFAGEFLKASATGVDHMRVDKTELSKDEARALFSREARRSELEGGKERPISVPPVPNGSELLVERTADGEHFYSVGIQAAHKKEGAFPLAEESGGTQRLLDLVPAVYQMQPGKTVYFIDEFDRSLHPMLVYKYLEYFLSTCTGSPCQIIVTTHETHLLDFDLLRRDEIWFAEKDSSEATHLYALTEFNVRRDLQVRKAYLGGRFGAVPFLGGFDQLRERRVGAASGRGQRADHSF